MPSITRCVASHATGISNGTTVEVARFPRVAGAGPYFKREHFDATFATGLEILLEGIQRARDKAQEP